jgi:hypothetical protein
MQVVDFTSRNPGGDCAKLLGDAGIRAREDDGVIGQRPAGL